MEQLRTAPARQDLETLARELARYGEPHLWPITSLMAAMVRAERETPLRRAS